MKFIFMIFFLLSEIFANEIFNGETKIFQIPIKQAQDLKINSKKQSWIKNPQNPNFVFTILVAPYKIEQKTIILENGESKLTYKIKEKPYKKEQIRVNQNKISPPKEIQKRIKQEFEEANKIYRQKTDGIYFNSKFIKPLNSAITSDFGTARIFNNTLKSFHGGTDFRAKIGTQILATNDGVVKLAKERYMAGGSVIIDHGFSIFSQYYHLSEILVKTGDFVKKGQIIAKSGDTGRVSGPHLHFGFMIEGKQINPLQFINEINSVLK